jgi:hypothetical protein
MDALPQADPGQEVPAAVAAPLQEVREQPSPENDAPREQPPVQEGMQAPNGVGEKGDEAQEGTQRPNCKEEKGEGAEVTLKKGKKAEVLIEIEDDKAGDPSWSVRPKRRAAQQGLKNLQMQLEEAKAQEKAKEERVTVKVEKKERKAEEDKGTEEGPGEEEEGEGEKKEDAGVEEEEEEVERIPRELRPAWLPDEHGRIPCPAAEWGGCGQGHLELQSFKGEGWIEDLRKRLREVLGEEGTTAQPSKVSRTTCVGWDQCSLVWTPVAGDQ